MPSRIVIVKTFGIALISLMLCAIFVSELPELLSLTDNTANDFTMCRSDSLASPVLGIARDVRQSAVMFNNFTRDSFFGSLGSAEKTGLAPLSLFILHSPLRT